MASRIDEAVQLVAEARRIELEPLRPLDGTPWGGNAVRRIEERDRKVLGLRMEAVVLAIAGNAEREDGRL
jgi:hypothetical protein